MRYLIVAVIQMLLIFAQARADIVVVVNSASELTELTQQQVIDIYMGRMQTVTNGGRVVPYDQPLDSEIRAAFYQHLTGKSVASVNAYWARLLFTGRAAPPKQVSDNMSIMNILAENLNAIGYIDEKDLDDRVSVVFKMTIDE
jgi:ABC-type phosphate transport system substrate-binding protein